MTPFRDSPNATSPGQCPRCRDRDLEPKDTGDIVVAACSQCRGLWLDGSKMLDLFTSSETELARLARLDDRPRGAAEGDAICPRCRAVMQREAGAVIDYDSCPRHGLWFDEGELRALLLNAGIESGAPADRKPPPFTIRKPRLIDRIVDAIMLGVYSGPDY